MKEFLRKQKQNGYVQIMIQRKGIYMFGSSIN